MYENCNVILKNKIIKIKDKDTKIVNIFNSKMIKTKFLLKKEKKI